MDSIRRWFIHDEQGVLKQLIESSKPVHIETMTSINKFEYDSNGRGLVRTSGGGTEVRITYQIGDKPVIASLKTNGQQLDVKRQNGRIVRLDLNRIRSLAISYEGAGKLKIDTKNPKLAYQNIGYFFGRAGHLRASAIQ